MKKVFVKWLIEKVFKTEIIEMVIPSKYTFKTYMPNDGEWHHVGITLEFWIKNGKVTEMVEDHNFDNVLVQEVRVWDDLFSKKKIKAIGSKNLTGKEKNLIGYWRLE